MDSLKNIANNQNTLLTGISRANLLEKSEQYVASLIAPGISEQNVILGAFASAAEPAAPVADKLGTDMRPNRVDFTKFSHIDFQMEAHELEMLIAREQIEAAKNRGYDEQFILEAKTMDITDNLKKNLELEVISTITTSSNYHSDVYDAAASTKWDADGGDPRKEIDDMIEALIKKGAPTSNIYIVAAPNVWNVCRRNSSLMGSRVDGLRSFATNDDVAYAIGGPGCHAIVASQQLANGNFAMGDKVAIVCRPENVGASSRCSWRICYNGSSTGEPSPMVKVYPPYGQEHRGLIVQASLDRQILATGANASGKQIWGGLIGDVLT